jgi:DNA (cytosine-5)-methyltransferase 1
VLQSAGFKYHQGAQAGNIGYEDEQSPTLTADYHQPAVALQTGHTAGNGGGFNTDDVSYTLSLANDHAVAFAQNNRNEVRLQNGDGSVTGPVAANDSAKGQGVPFVCMADDTQNAAIDENLSGTLKVGGGTPTVVYATPTEAT